MMWLFGKISAACDWIIEALEAEEPEPDDQFAAMALERDSLLAVMNEVAETLRDIRDNTPSVGAKVVADYAVKKLEAKATTTALERIRAVESHAELGRFFHREVSHL